MAKRNGDHFEGQWVDDLREGQGSFFYSGKNKLFVGEWVADQPKCGVYTEVEDEEAVPKIEKPYFTDPYQMPPIPATKLENPTKILERAMEKAKRLRARHRAQFIPVEEMFTPQEYYDLKQAFGTVAQGEEVVNMLSLKTLFAEMGIYPTDEMIEELLRSCGKKGEEDDINFELFARSVALLLEENIEHGSTSSARGEDEVPEEERESEGGYQEEEEEAYSEA